MVQLCILTYILSDASIEILFNKSVMRWELRHFFILIIGFLFYTIVEKVIETFLSLDFLDIIPNSTDNTK